MGRRVRNPSDPESLERVLEQTVSRLGLKKGADQWKAIHVWPRAVGKQIARLTRPLYVSDGVLFVGTSSSAWANELDFQKREILKRIQVYLGDAVIRDIRFYSNPWKEETSISPPGPTPVNQADARFIRETAEGIESAQLKSVLERVLARWVAHRKKET